MSLDKVSGGSNWGFEGNTDNSKPSSTKESKYPLAVRAKALSRAFGEVGVGKISLGITKVVGGIILRNTAKLLPSGETKSTIQRQSKELKHSGIQIAAKTASVYMSTLLKSSGWSVKVPLMNIAKHEQVCSQFWAKPEDTEAAEALIDGMLDTHLIREDRENPLAKLGLARAQVREAMNKYGVEEQEIHIALREPRSKLKEWNKTVDGLRATRDALLNEHGVNDPRTSTIPAVQDAQRNLEMAMNVLSRLEKLASRNTEARDAPSPFIRLTESPKGQDIQRSGNLNYHYADSSKLTAVRDGICFGSCIRWATQYNALATDAKGNGKGLDALEIVLSTADQHGMDVQASANQLTYQRLEYFPQVDFARSTQALYSILVTPSTITPTFTLSSLMAFSAAKKACSFMKHALPKMTSQTHKSPSKSVC